MTKRNKSVSVFGAAMLAGITVAQAQFTIIHPFSTGAAFGDLTLSTDGQTLYGMTTRWDGGEIFSMNISGSDFNPLHAFNGSDGSSPHGSLTLSGEMLYGMTDYGGGNNAGVVFKLNTSGTDYTVLHSFTGISSDGAAPRGSLILSGSLLYGMTSGGGDFGGGTLFKMNSDGSSYTALHAFNGSDGASPNGSLTLSNGKLYGTTSGGGDFGGGTLFEMNSDGSGYTLLHSFNGSDGANPNGSLTLSNDGTTLYGLTVNGGINGNGAIFSISTNGTFTLLHSCSEWDANPYGSLTLSGDGSTMYGMTQYGGANNGGTIFQINTDGSTFGVDCSFPEYYPQGSLTLSADATTLYGMTPNDSMIFSFNIQAIPEPTSVLSLLSAGALITLARRIRRVTGRWHRA